MIMQIRPHASKDSRALALESHSKSMNAFRRARAVALRNAPSLGG